MLEYRVVVPSERAHGAKYEEIMPPTREDDCLFQDFKPDAESCSIIGPDANKLLGSWGLALTTLLEWRAEDPQRRHNQGRVERRQTTEWGPVIP